VIASGVRRHRAASATRRNGLYDIIDYLVNIE